MSDSQKQILRIILEHIEVCEIRFAGIKNANDFIDSRDGNLILDAIGMRLQAAGESTKKLLKLIPEIQSKYPEINWGDIVMFRDFISHHYELLDYEIVYDICNIHLPKLKIALTKELSQ